MKISKNKRAEKIVGKRNLPDNVIIFDEPCEIGYHCPVCKYENPKDGFDERLQWSEYNGFIWCSTCNKDYPSALCQPDIDKAIKTYLQCVSSAINYHHEKMKSEDQPKKIFQTSDEYYKINPK